MVQPLFWISCTGPAVWISGIASYMLLNYYDDKEYDVEPWRLFMFSVGMLTLIVWSWLLYPSSPTDAKFLTIEERVSLIVNVSLATSSAIEQKQVKKHQIMNV